MSRVNALVRKIGRGRGGRRWWRHESGLKIF